MGWTNISKSPLDGVVAAIDDVRHGSRAAKAKAKAIKDAPKNKAKKIVARVTGADMPKKPCNHIGGKRGKNCGKCGTKLL